MMIKNSDETPTAPAIILARPQMGENIGAAARAMQNFGLTDLRLIAPRDGWPNENAQATASGAFDSMPPVRVYEDMTQATADLHFTFATTSRRRDMVKPVYDPQGALEETTQRLNSGQKVGFVFGAERTGLLNDELSQCQAIITFPVNPAFASINLSQAVLLMAYEWGKNETQCIDHTAIDFGDSFPAKQADIQSFIERLEQDLEERRFFRARNLKPTMLRNIQNIFTRADISDQELRTLHGMLSALRGNKTDK